MRLTNFVAGSNCATIQKYSSIDVADMCLSGIERWGDLVSSTCQVNGVGDGVPNTMSETGGGRPVRVRGDVKLGFIALGSCCRPPSLTNREVNTVPWYPLVGVC